MAGKGRGSHIFHIVIVNGNTFQPYFYIHRQQTTRQSLQTNIQVIVAVQIFIEINICSDGENRVKTMDLNNSLKLSSYFIIKKTIEYLQMKLDLVEGQSLTYSISKKKDINNI